MENKNLKKNKQISQTMSETRKKRQNQICRVFHVKIQENKLSKLQKEQLQMIFVEGKRYKNHIINWSNQDKENNKIWNFDTKIKEITISDKDKNLSQYKLQYIPASIKQTILDEMCANIKTLSSLKKKGYKVGKLKFCKELKSVTYKQYGVTHKIVSSKRIKLQGVKGTIVVNGLNQFINENVDYADFKLLNTPCGYYVSITTFTDKEKIKMARTFNANRFQLLTKIVIPANISTFINSLKVNIGLSLVGVISGEFLVSKAGLRILNSIWRASIPT